VTEVCELSVVVPTRNEAANLGALHEQLMEALAGIEYEVIIVDDSNDEVTRPMLRQIAAGDRNWRVIERDPSEQGGLGTAVFAGLALAVGTAVCVMDADLQHPPSVVPRLLAAIREGADLAVASRYTTGGSAAGLAGPFRKAVSRGVSWVAQCFFAESRRTTDPLSGFFCVRQSCVAGLEMRPIGFKILLELLVCLPAIHVTDVPFAFGPRYSGVSKATLAQGVLFGRHVLSLFIYVPLTALLGKVAFSAGAGMGVFVICIAILTQLPLQPPTPWLVASGTSLLASVAVYSMVTFRSALWRVGMAGQWLLWAMGLASVAGGILSFALLAAKARAATVLVALIAQLVALAVGYGMVSYVRYRGRRLAPAVSVADELSLQALARRLGADRAWWAEALQPVDSSHRLEDMVGADLVNHVTRTRRPLLMTELPSSRPQTRVNVESFSLILVPRLNGGRRVTRIAVLARAGRTSFSARDLHAAVTWSSRQESSWLAGADDAARGTGPVPEVS